MELLAPPTPTIKNLDFLAVAVLRAEHVLRLADQLYRVAFGAASAILDHVAHVGCWYDLLFVFV